MSGHDPLEGIMGTLRGAKAIDPASAAHRKAGMQQERRRVGAAPTSQRGSPVPDKRSREEGTDTQMTAPQTTMPIIIDALNESIIALKVEIHRTTDQEKRRELEMHASKLRKEVQELGGEPVWADETVEEGLAKLSGHGFVAQNRLQQSAGTGNPWPSIIGLTPPGRVGAESGQPLQGQFSQEPVRVGPTIGVPDFPGVMTPAQGEYIGDPRAHMQSLPQGGNIPGMPGMPDMGDHFSDLLRQIGGISAGRPTPAPQVDDAYVNNLLNQYGLTPRSSEEIADHARAVVERMKFSREQLVQKELDRFERNHPPEFARAQDQITRAASAVSADKQEEFANRGMFYSTVMAGNLQEIDAKTMDLIGQIASESANYVIDLRQDLRDISEWAILEEEVLRRELEVENRQFSMQLANVRLQVAMWADQMALDRWAQEETFRLQESQLRLQAASMQLAQAQAAGDLYSAAFMSDHPDVAAALRKMGYTPDMIAQMPIEQRAGLVQGALQGEEYRFNAMQYQNMADITALDIAIKGQQVKIGQWELDSLPEAHGEDAPTVQSQFQEDWSGVGGWWDRLSQPAKVGIGLNPIAGALGHTRDFLKYIRADEPKK